MLDAGAQAQTPSVAPLAYSMRPLVNDARHEAELQRRIDEAIAHAVAVGSDLDDDIDALDEALQPASPQRLQPEAAYASSQTVQAYLATIEALPPRCREAFCMYLFDELSNQQIAERMGVSISMVNQYISRGKIACAARKQELDHGD